jgi:hypothetical protein
MKTVRSFSIAGLLMLSPALAETPVTTVQMSKAQARERLADCATQWQQMKSSGSDGSMIWREFSSLCMARPATAPGAPTRNTTTRNENASPAR